MFSQPPENCWWLLLPCTNAMNVIRCAAMRSDAIDTIRSPVINASDMYIFVPVAEDRGGKADTLKSSAKNLYADIIPAQPRVFNSWTNLSFTWPEMVIPLKKTQTDSVLRSPFGKSSLLINRYSTKHMPMTEPTTHSLLKIINHHRFSSGGGRLREYRPENGVEEQHLISISVASQEQYHFCSFICERILIIAPASAWPFALQHELDTHVGPTRTDGESWESWKSGSHTKIICVIWEKRNTEQQFEELKEEDSR